MRRCLADEACGIAQVSSWFVDVLRHHCARTDDHMGTDFHRKHRGIGSDADVVTDLRGLPAFAFATSRATIFE